MRLRVLALLAALLPGAALAQQVTIDFTGRVESFFFIDQVNGTTPADHGLGAVAPGAAVSGSLVYDLSKNTDANPAASFGTYADAVVKASFSVGAYGNVITPPAGLGSDVTFNDDHTFVAPVTIDRFFARAYDPTGGAIFGAHATLDLVWATTALATLTSDAMQVLPLGVAWGVPGAVGHQINYSDNNSGSVLDGNRQQLSIGAAIESYGVTVIPEPETWTLLLAGLGLLGFAARWKVSP